MDKDELPWKIIDTFFKDDSQILVRHHIDSFNDFYNNGLRKTMKEMNPIKLQKEQDEKTRDFRRKCFLYMGGKDADKIYYGKPMIYDEDRQHYMYPNEARMRNMTYGMTIHVDVEVEFEITLDSGEVKTHSITLDKIYMGTFPIMLQSEFCILSGLSQAAKYNMGECKNDFGGYFIIDGKEKVIISQEKFANNMLYLRTIEDDKYSHSAEIKTVSEDSSKPARTIAVKIVTPTTTFTNNQIVVTIPNVRNPVPLFIVMRALGIESDKKIIEYCLHDLNKEKEMVDMFIPSIHDAGVIFTQREALNFMKELVKGKTVFHVQDILMNYFMPQVGELNYHQKAMFLGYIVKKLLMVKMGIEKPTDRDSFRFKRVDVPGILIGDLFKEYYKMQLQHVRLEIDKQYKYKTAIYRENFVGLIQDRYGDYFKERITEAGFKKAFKGNWGSTEHTKKLGAVQDLNRLSYNSFLSHLRKINLPMPDSAKVVKPRLLHGSQWGLIDPVDTPDGGNVGFHKHMAISTHITSGYSKFPMIDWLDNNLPYMKLEECQPSYIHGACKLFVNGTWIGIIESPVESVRFLKKNRRHALIPVMTSISWTINTNEIQIFTDGGRLCRPVYFIDENKKPSYDKPAIMEKIMSGAFTWNNLITGFASKRDYGKNKLYSLKDLYSTDDFQKLEGTGAIVDYIDTSEEENLLIASKEELLEKNPRYTNLEIHPSLLLGVMGNQIVFPENNQLPRDLFACGQAKQAVSLYHSNYLSRIDKMGVVLNYGQVPLVKSRYMEYINHEQHPYGENCIVAIGVYGSYNVEDSILFNEGSVKRGLFRTTYYNMYESREESSRVGASVIDSHFVNIENENVVGIKPGYDYSRLDEYGMIEMNSEIDDKTVVIGKSKTNLENPDVSIDASIFPKKGQLGYVDKTFITEEEEGFRLAKVRIREERMPAIGDKFCSRCGQKGTVGILIPEEDMPFTEDGIKPDIIINPHALPSRMTIGQLIETVMGKACVMTGGFGSCTAFENKGPKHKEFGKILVQNGFHDSGNQILYNGSSGEQLSCELFMGPTYYMRLKHMVKDKINYRAQGPRTMLTRQTVGGRANDGGLRIGEMERDGIIAHGAAGFLNESMLVRGDEYFMAVCNITGTIAIYNEANNLFMSPMADGPLKFTGNLSNTMNIEKITRFGRSFSVLRIPYSFKLLIQELQVMNVQMRLITEDNIDQITSMNFSSNANKLAGLDNIEDVNAGLTELIRSSTAEIRKSDTNMPYIPDREIGKNKQEAAIIPDIIEESTIDPDAFAWQQEGFDADGTEKYISIILDANGDPVETWSKEDNKGYSKPYRYPTTWESPTYDDGSPINAVIVIDALKENQVPNNLKYVLEKIRMDKIGYELPYSPPFAPGTPGQVDGRSMYYTPDESTSPDYPPPGSPDYPPPGSPDYPPPGSPNYPPPGTPPYRPDSPDYQPDGTPYPPGSPDYPPGSPAYAPGSPAYAPYSPAYAPGSPAYAPSSNVYDPISPPYSVALGRTMTMQEFNHAYGIESPSPSSDGSIPPPPPPESSKRSSSTGTPFSDEEVNTIAKNIESESIFNVKDDTEVDIEVDEIAPDGNTKKIIIKN